MRQTCQSQLGLFQFTQDLPALVCYNQVVQTSALPLDVRYFQTSWNHVPRLSYSAASNQAISLPLNDRTTQEPRHCWCSRHHQKKTRVRDAPARRRNASNQWSATALYEPNSYDDAKQTDVPRKCSASEMSVIFQKFYTFAHVRGPQIKKKIGLHGAVLWGCKPRVVGVL